MGLRTITAPCDIEVLAKNAARARIISQLKCQYCHGAGKVNNFKCSACAGKGTPPNLWHKVKALVGQWKLLPLIYQDPVVKRNAAALVMTLALSAPSSPLTGPVDLELTFVYPWLKTTPQWWQKWEHGPVYKHTAPDLGNLEKQIEDVFETAGFLGNDGQIARKTVLKIYGPELLVKIKLAELPGPQRGRPAATAAAELPLRPA